MNVVFIEPGSPVEPCAGRMPLGSWRCDLTETGVARTGSAERATR